MSRDHLSQKTYLTPGRLCASGMRQPSPGCTGISSRRFVTFRKLICCFCSAGTCHNLWRGKKKSFWCCPGGKWRDWLSPSASVNKVNSANKPSCDSEAHLLLPTNTWRYTYNYKNSKWSRQRHFFNKSRQEMRRENSLKWKLNLETIHPTGNNSKVYV